MKLGQNSTRNSIGGNAQCSRNWANECTVTKYHILAHSAMVGHTLNNMNSIIIIPELVQKISNVLSHCSIKLNLKLERKKNGSQFRPQLRRRALPIQVRIEHRCVCVCVGDGVSHKPHSVYKEVAWKSYKTIVHYAMLGVMGCVMCVCARGKERSLFQAKTETK